MHCYFQLVCTPSSSSAATIHLRRHEPPSTTTCLLYPTLFFPEILHPTPSATSLPLSTPYSDPILRLQTPPSNLHPNLAASSLSRYLYLSFLTTSVEKEDSHDFHFRHPRCSVLLGQYLTISQKMMEPLQ